MKKATVNTLAVIAVLSVLLTACEHDYYGGGQGDDKIPRAYKQFYNIESMERVGDTIIITTLDLPDHTSPFYEETDPLYEPYTGDNSSFSTSIVTPRGEIDPDILATEITLKIPIKPVALETGNEATNLGPIGIALNGVVFFNQYNGSRELLDAVEFNNIDQWNGHPSPRLSYHYHFKPTWLLQERGNDALMGFLLDGFPVYGDVEYGETLTSSDLDEFHGHFGKTREYRKGIYHYHFTEDAPWLNGDGFKGAPGILIE